VVSIKFNCFQTSCVPVKTTGIIRKKKREERGRKKYKGYNSAADAINESEIDELVENYCDWSSFYK
jgi:hypothetical protein